SAPENGLIDDIERIFRIDQLRLCARERIRRVSVVEPDEEAGLEGLDAQPRFLGVMLCITEGCVVTGATGEAELLRGVHLERVGVQPRVVDADHVDAAGALRGTRPPDDLTQRAGEPSVAVR